MTALLKRGLIAGAIVVIATFGAGCSGSKDAPDDEISASGEGASTAANTGKVDRHRRTLEREFATLARQGDPYGKLFATVKEVKPAVYEEFMGIAAAAMADGKTPEEAGAIARPVFLAEFSKALGETNDATLTEAIEFTLFTYRELNRTDPRECVRNVQGLPPSNMAAFTKDITTRESALMEKVFRNPAKKELAIATQADVVSWMGDIFATNPELVANFSNVELPSPTREQATRGCSAMITLFEEMGKESQSRSAALFRGMLAMAP